MQSANSELRKVSALTPFWPTKNVDPIKIWSVGDWAMLRNLYSNLVELDGKTSVRPGLAESWSHSSDDLIWTFRLRRDLKWSDGSRMLVSEIVASLKRAALGTTHSQVHTYLDRIESVSDDEIKFFLKKFPENFLLNIAFADFAITHPQAYAHDFIWRVKSSGPYRIEKFSENKIRLLKNPNFWNSNKIEPTQIEMTRASGNSSDLELITKGSNFNVIELPPGLILEKNKINKLNERFEIFHGEFDFNFIFLFSRNEKRHLKFSIEIRRFLLSQTQSHFWSEEENDDTRSVGLRHPGLRGSIDLKTLKSILDEIRNSDFPQDIPKQLDVLVADSEIQRPLVIRMLEALASTGIELVKKVVPKNKMQHTFEEGDFDLAVFLLGTSENDPDSAWRIYQKLLPKVAVSDLELDQAQSERDASTRNSLYQDLEKRNLREAWFIPVKNDYVYILTDRAVSFDKDQVSAWGLQFSQLRFRL